MKKTVLLICCTLLLLTSCINDPYSDQRPADYGDALWTCDAYDLWFRVDLEKEDYYDPEGELELNGNNYFCKFYFIHQTNQLHISVYPLDYKTIPDESRDREAVIGSIEGECNFSNESFTFSVDKIEGDISNFNIKEMVFTRTEV